MRRTSMLRPAVLAGIIGLVLSVSSVTASAATRLVFSEDEENPKRAGKFCDFKYTVRFHYTLEITVFDDGRERWQWTLPATHINLDTGYTVSETSRYTTLYYSDHEKSVGLFFQLRAPNGRIAAVHAGQLSIGDSGVKF